MEEVISIDINQEKRTVWSKDEEGRQKKDLSWREKDVRVEGKTIDENQ